MLSEAILSIGGMSCTSCSSTVTTTIQSLPGVLRCSVDLIGETATIIYHERISINEIVSEIEDVGFDASVLIRRTFDEDLYHQDNTAAINGRGESSNINNESEKIKSYGTAQSQTEAQQQCASAPKEPSRQSYVQNLLKAFPFYLSSLPSS